jgi:hypothetical protein
VRLEGFGKRKSLNDLIGTRTRDLEAFLILPQATSTPKLRAASILKLHISKELYLSITLALMSVSEKVMYNEFVVSSSGKVDAKCNQNSSCDSEVETSVRTAKPI